VEAVLTVSEIEHEDVVVVAVKGGHERSWGCADLGLGRISLIQACLRPAWNGITDLPQLV
jgi:hypothetical protein